MASPARRVIKIGGSLLDFEALVPAFRDWAAAQPAAVNVLVAGGGQFAEAVRDIDQRFGLQPASAHWLCVRLLDVTTRMLALLFPEAEFVDRYEDLVTSVTDYRDRLILFSAEEFLQHHEPRMGGPALPADWRATSDSIAARLATALRANELVLLKSADPPQPVERDLAARQGYVDEYFPQVAHALPRVRCVNLRQGREYVM